MGLFSSVLERLDLIGLCLLGLCGILGIWKIPLYFRALRPRLGTTEWMAKVDGAHFAPLLGQKLSWMDGPWLLLGGLLAAVLHLFVQLFSLELHKSRALFESLLEHAPMLLERLALAGALGGLLYLLLRLLFAKPLPALCISALSGLGMAQRLDTALLLSCSLLCLYFWMARESDKGLFPGGLFLPPAMLLCTLAVLTEPACLSLLPFFLGAYFWKLIYRFRKGNREGRVVRLLLSLFLSLLSAGFCLLVFAAGAGLLSQGLGLSSLRSLDFYRGLLPALKVYLLGLLQPSLAPPLSPKELLHLIWCLPAIFLLLHGVISRRQSPCLWLLLLLPGLLALWLLGGAGLLCMPLLLCLGYVYAVLGQREKNGWALLGTVIFCVFLGIFTILY